MRQALLRPAGLLLSCATMPGSLIATKLFMPTLRAGVVDRGRLNERLQRGGAARLTLVSAPAGFGKTTAASPGSDRVPPAGRWRGCRWTRPTTSRRGSGPM